LNIYIVGSIALLMICLGIAVEIALHISNTYNGSCAYRFLTVRLMTLL